MIVTPPPNLPPYSPISLNKKIDGMTPKKQLINYNKAQKAKLEWKRKSCWFGLQAAAFFGLSNPLNARLAVITFAFLSLSLSPLPIRFVVITQPRAFPANFLTARLASARTHSRSRREVQRDFPFPATFHLTRRFSLPRVVDESRVFPRVVFTWSIAPSVDLPSSAQLKQFFLIAICFRSASLVGWWLTSTQWNSRKGY